MRKIFSGAILGLYLLWLVWLVLFKLKFNIPSVLHIHHRSLNLVPFAAPSIVNGKTNYGEIIDNCIFFIPFGLLLNVYFKKIAFLPKLACVLAFSVAAETIQYLFAIGATDITDVIMNTFGGFLGLKLYQIGNKLIGTEKSDRIIVITGTILLVLFVSLQLSHFSRR